MQRSMRPSVLTVFPAVLGVIGATVIAVAAGILPTNRHRLAPLWWGARPATTKPGEALAGWMFLGGVVALTLAWVLLVRSAPSVRRAGWTAVIWAVPLVLGTPAASHDIHAYLAHGVMLDQGIDPNSVGPHELGPGRILAAVDPRWRASPAPYGPIALTVSRAAGIVGEHWQIGGLLVLRAVACAGVLLAGWCLLRLVPACSGATLAAAVASPLVMVSVVSAGHHEGLLVGLIMAALLAHARGRPGTAYALATAAGMVKVPGFIVLAGLGTADLWLAASWLARGRVLARGLIAGAIVSAVGWVLVPHPFGWLSALSTPGLGRTKWAPVTLAADVFPGGAVGWRTAGQVLAVLIVVLLLVSSRRRPVAATIGWSLLVVGLLGPVLYPWYLVPPAIVLSIAHGRWTRRVVRLAGGGALWVGLPRLGNIGLLFGR